MSDPVINQPIDEPTPTELQTDLVTLTQLISQLKTEITGLSGRIEKIEDVEKEIEKVAASAGLNLKRFVPWFMMFVPSLKTAIALVAGAGVSGIGTYSLTPTKVVETKVESKVEKEVIPEKQPEASASQKGMKLVFVVSPNSVGSAAAIMGDPTLKALLKEHNCTTMVDPKSDGESYRFRGTTPMPPPLLVLRSSYGLDVSARPLTTAIDAVNFIKKEYQVK